MVNRNSEGDKSILLWKGIIALLISMIVLIQLDKAWGVAWGYSDEIGYWGTAAMLTGHDWSDFMSNISYYSFIYGILLIPIMLLPFSSIVLYRLAIMLNAAMLLAAYFVSCKCIEEIFPKVDKKIIAVACTVGILYSSNIFYAQNTNGEILYLLLFWLLLYSCLYFLKKMTVVSAIVFVTLSVVNFAAHMRSLSLVFAAMITIIVVSIAKKNLKIVFGSGLAIIVEFLEFQFLKSWILQAVYIGGEYTKYNDISGQGEKLANFLSIQGLKNIAAMCLGRFFYLGTSSFLLIYIGIFICIFFSVRALKLFYARKNKITRIEKEIESQFWPAMIFLLSALVFSIGISALYFQDPGEYISFVYYGRYTEYLIGPFLIIAVIMLYIGIEKIKYILISSVVLHLLICSIIYIYLGSNGISQSAIHPNTVGTAGMLIQLGSSSIVQTTFGIGIVAAIIGVILSGVICFQRSEKRQNVGRRICIFSFLICSLWVGNTYAYVNSALHSESAYNTQQQYFDLAEQLSEVKMDETILFPFDGILNGTGSVCMTYLQYKIPDVKIDMVSIDDVDVTRQIQDTDWLLWSPVIEYPANLEKMRDEFFELVEKNNLMCLYKKKVSS